MANGSKNVKFAIAVDYTGTAYILKCLTNGFDMGILDSRCINDEQFKNTELILKMLDCTRLSVVLVGMMVITDSLKEVMQTGSIQ